MESGKKKDRNTFLKSTGSGLLSKHTGKSLSRRLKLYTDEDIEGGKLTSETLQDLIQDMSKDRQWRGYDILYYINILSNNNQNKKSIEFYFFLFYSFEQSIGYGVIVSVRGRDIEFKQSWNLMDIKSIKFSNSNLNEFILTVDEDYNWRTISNIDRDEIIWVLIYVCQYLCDHDIKPKSIDLQQLSNAISTKGTLTRFNLLKKFLDENMDDTMNPYNSTGDLLSFTPEEADAEKLFDEFQWGMVASSDGPTNSNADPAILQKKLKTESDILHIEICDFLLQWEDDDLIDHSIAMASSGSSSHDGELKGNANASARETLEMLTVLTQVDHELKSVDDWLKTQVNYLNTVQKELFQIEAENSTLETSWHNLSAVKSMITSLLAGPLSLASDHETDLRSPLKYVKMALYEDKELKNTSSILSRLVDALESLRKGIYLIEGNDPTFQNEQWESLQTMSVITYQRNKLLELSNIVCNSLSEMVSNLFKILLQHKALTDPSTNTNTNTIRKDRTILIRKYSFSSITNRVKEQQGRYLVVNDEIESSTDDPSSSMSTSESSLLSPALSINNMNIPHQISSSIVYGTVTNQLLIAQQVYHETILPFIPLLENLSALSPSLSTTLTHSYIEATEGYFYSPLCKEMFRELFSAIPPRQSPVFTLSSAPKSMAKKMNSPVLRFQHPSMCRSGTPLSVTPWTVYAIAIKMIEDVASREKFFLLQVIKKLMTTKKTVNADQDYLASTLSKLFEQFRERVLRLVSNTEYSDGIEIIAMLVTTDMLLVNHRVPTATSTTTATSGEKGGNNSSSKSLSDESNSLPLSTGYEVDLVGSLLSAAKAILQDRLNEFVNSQIAWIKLCKEDPKKSNILLPISKFPAFVDQMKEFSGDKRFECVDETLQKIGKELMTWLHAVASQNEKYHNMVLIQNLEYLVESLSLRDDVISLQRLSLQATEQKMEAERRYIEWMVSYEFPSYTQLADRVKELGKRASSEEMGLYVRREDVSRAVSRMDKKTLETSIGNIRKRLEKHFSGFTEASGLTIIPRLWALLQEDLCRVFKVIEDVAQSSYQITLMVDATIVKTLCEKEAS